jgi:hypothetical protein
MHGASSVLGRAAHLQAFARRTALVRALMTPPSTLCAAQARPAWAGGRRGGIRYPAIASTASTMAST